MNERQYNSKLLGDKLSQLPVPPNEALWNRIEAQLLVVPPAVQQPPTTAAHTAKLAKAVGAKTTIAIVATVLLVVFIIWLANKKAPQQQSAPAIQKTKQPVVVDSSAKADTATVLPTKPIPEKVPLVIPDLKPVSPDTQTLSAPLLPNRKTIDTPLRDSAPVIMPPAAAVLRADSVRISPKKDEGYYFEVKKKKRDSIP